MKEEEIRPEKFDNKQMEFYMEDVKNLLKRKNEFINVNCPACGTNNFEKSFEKYDHTYVTCKECETMFISPRPTPEILSQFYETSKRYEFWNKFIFPNSEEARREKIFKPRAEKIINICKKYNTNTNTIIDVGAGYGTFCEEIKKLEFFKKVIAIEPTPSLAKTCQERGLEVINRGIEEIKINQEVDVITSFEVIEHLFSPKEFLLSCKEILSKNGLIVITCPNIKGFDISTLKEKSDIIDTEHLNYFNLNSLSKLFSSCGFEVIEKLTPGKLDAELVRKKILKGELDISNNEFLKQVLIERWDELGNKFQKFIEDNSLSTHMWIIGRKI